MKKWPLLFPLFFLALFTSSFSQQPLNLDFETESSDGVSRPWGWSSYYFGREAFSAMDSLNPRSGKYALKVSNKAKTPYSIGYWIAPRMLRGKTVKVKGWGRTGSADCKYWMEMNTWGDYGKIDSIKTSVVGTQEVWMPMEAEIKIDSAAYSLLIEIHSSGNGDAFFDDLSLEIDGKIITEIPVASEIGAKELALLAKHTYPFESVKASTEEDPKRFDDLMHFGKMVKGAKIIGLGESTHGTSEFFSMKHRLLEYAVYNLGTRVFAFEDNQLAVEKINDYVLYGKSEAEVVISRLFGIWNTTEVLNIIEWIRNYNIKHPNDKIEFVGFDAQNPILPIEKIASDLMELDPILKERVDTLHLDFYKAWQKNQYPRSDYATMKKWHDDATKAYDLMVDKSEDWLRHAKSEAEKNKIAWLLQHARSVANAALTYTGDVAIRDQYMAENISWIIKQKNPKGPIVVWAHDVHINHGHGPDEVYNYFGGQSMGTYLRKEYGAAYKAFGFFTYEGKYASYANSQPIEAIGFPAPKGSFDEALHRLTEMENTANYIFDLTWARKNPYDYFWMLEPRPVRFATYFAFDYGYETMVSLPFQFDGIIFINKTNAAVKLK